MQRTRLKFFRFLMSFWVLYVYVLTALSLSFDGGNCSSGFKLSGVKSCIHTGCNPLL